MTTDSILLMREALELVALELEFVQKEETDEAVALAEKRQELISLAWQNKDNTQNHILHQQLLEMSKMQESLTEAARAVSNKLRSEIKHVKQQSVRMSGYSYSLSIPSEPERINTQS